MNIGNMKLSDLVKKIRARELLALELVEHYLNTIQQKNEQLNAFVAVDFDRAIDQAKKVDSMPKDELEQLGLPGIPFGVKDLEDLEGFQTTCGSVLLGDSPIKKTSSVLVSRLLGCGAIGIGKTNTPEFGYKADTENPLFGATRNPIDISRSAGGSSGGSAAAVASGMIPFATASDGGGSIRIPSSLCCLPGYKPTLGIVPSGGDEPNDWADLSTKGIIAKTFNDIVYVLNQVVGIEYTDLNSINFPEFKEISKFKPVKLGYSETLGYAEIDLEVREVIRSSIDKLSDSQIEVIEIDSIFELDPMLAWIDEVSIYLDNRVSLLRSHPNWEMSDPLLRALCDYGSTLDTTRLLQCQKSHHFMNLQLAKVFSQVHFLATPTIAGKWPLVGNSGTINGKEDINWLKFTYPFNMTHSPAITVPVGRLNDSMPVGLQIVANRFRDEDLLSLGLFLSELFSEVLCS